MKGAAALDESHASRDAEAGAGAAAAAAAVAAETVSSPWLLPLLFGAAADDVAAAVARDPMRRRLLDALAAKLDFAGACAHKPD